MKMYLKRRRPIHDKIWDRSIADFLGADFTLNQPAANIVEHDDRFEIAFAAPGLEKENFKIKVEKDYLIVASEVKTEENISEGTFTRREFNYTSFKRKFYLPKAVNKDEISAEYNNGILTVSLNKKEEAKDKAAMEIAIK